MRAGGGGEHPGRNNKARGKILPDPPISVRLGREYFSLPRSSLTPPPPPGPAAAALPAPSRSPANRAAACRRAADQRRLQHLVPKPSRSGAVGGGGRPAPPSAAATARLPRRGPQDSDTAPRAATGRRISRHWSPARAAPSRGCTASSATVSAGPARSSRGPSGSAARTELDLARRQHPQVGAAPAGFGQQGLRPGQGGDRPRAAG